MTTLDSDPLLLAAYLYGHLQATEDLLPVLDDTRRERDDALRERDEARRDALIDPLTALRNRRAAEHHLRAAALGGANLWLALVDARDLKKVNDTHGHTTGDRMLQAVATALSAVTDSLPGAIAFRYGGDEFLLTTHDDDLGQPERIAGLIHAHLVGYGTANPDRHQPEVSIGWAKTRQDVPAGDALEAAGIALAAAKQIDTPRGGTTVRTVLHQNSSLPRGAETDHRRMPAQRTINHATASQDA